MSDRDKKDLGIVVLFIVAIISLIYSIGKAIINLFSVSAEKKKIASLVREGLAKNMTEEQIVQVFSKDAEEQLGRSLTPKEKSKITFLVRTSQNRES